MVSTGKLIKLLTGAEQSGFINDIGFETYQKILKEAVEELKSSN